MITRQDDFNLARTDKFVEKVILVIEEEQTVFKKEKDVFRIIGLDVKVVEEGVDILMDDYSQSLKDILDIRKMDDRDEELSKLEMQLYRKYIDKIAGLANSTRPDLCYLAMRMSKKNQGATMTHL